MCENTRFTLAIAFCRLDYASRMPSGTVQLLHVPHECRDSIMIASHRPSVVMVMYEEGSAGLKSASVGAPVRARVWYGAGSGDLYLEAMEPAWSGLAGKLQLGWRGRQDDAGEWILCQLVAQDAVPLFKQADKVKEEAMPQP